MNLLWKTENKAYHWRKAVFPLNILIIDDLLVPERAKADSAGKVLFCKAAEENLRRRIFLADSFQRFGANVLLLRAELCSSKSNLSFDFRESGGLSQLFIRIPTASKSFLHFRELFEFSAAISENSPSLSGIFSPDVVIAGGILPFSVSAGTKLCDFGNAILISELSSFPKEVLQKFGLCSAFNPVLRFLNKSFEQAFFKSHAVLGAFPLAPQKFSGAHNLYPMVLPPVFTEEKPSANGALFREKLSAFGEGKTFVLAFCGELEEGCSIEELILSAGAFGDRFALVFLSEGRKKSCFKRFIAERGITNVFFLEGALREEIPFILSGADGIFVAESSLGKGLFPEQEAFWSALGAQKPVIAASEHWADFFRKAGGVIITKPRRKDSITLGIKTLLSMSEADRETLGRANRNFFEKNSAENFAKDCFSLFDNLVNQKEIKK